MIKLIESAKLIFYNSFNILLHHFSIDYSFFNCHTPKFSLSDLCCIDYNSKFTKPITATSKSFKLFINLKLQFDYLCLQRKLYRDMYRSISNTKPFISSFGEQTTLDNLSHLSDHFNIVYFYKFRLPYCKDKLPLEFDFFCFLFYDSSVYPFVIEFDGAFHSNDTLDTFEIYHVHDILKQYYLSQLSVHILRINTINNNITTLENFINKMINNHNNKYISVNSIKPISKYFQNKSIHKGLKFFNDYCSNQFKLLNNDNQSLKCICDREYNDMIDLLKIPNEHLLNN